MRKEDPSLKNSKICFLGSFPPRECGIATFTKDLSSSMNKKFNPHLKSRIIALNENNSFYNYDNQVIIQINKSNIEDFINVAKKINNSKDIKLVCIQHEFGLFGGKYGSYLLSFLETIEKPVVVTFHSVLPNPDEARKKVVKFIASKSAAIIVMAEKAVDILVEDYDIRKEKINMVFHGIPNVPFLNSFNLKKKLRLDNKIILSTFGLLSRGKGIEYVIRALPSLIKKYPNLLYLVVGETHPSVRKKEGENYRNELIREVEKLGLKGHVKFYNKYLTLQEIINYLLVSDIYISASTDKNQIVSGTLSYALGCGKAVISTPIAYAKEILADERGILTEFKNPDSFSKAIDGILSDKELKLRLEKNAYSFSRIMTWSNVSTRYLNIFNKVVRLREETVQKYPFIKLNHFKNLTDNFGIIQFSKHSAPDKGSGYTVDDNSRALIAAILHHEIFKSQLSLSLAKRYLVFLEYTQAGDGRFRNVIKENRISDDNFEDSEDAFGRAIWSLGYAIDQSSNPEIRERAKKIFDKSYNLIEKLNSPRAKAFSIIGLYHHYKKYKDKESIIKIRKLADSLVELYEKQSFDDWPWFEKYLTYSNSKLPESLFLVYELTKDERYLKVAEKTFRFLSDILFTDGQLAPVGQGGWYDRNGERAFFDQQPIDASAMVQTCLTAYSVTKNKEHYKKAVLAFNWFLGKNYLKQMMYDESNGGCYDGLSENSINLNQGAESTISYLIARLMLEETKRNKKIYDKFKKKSLISTRE